MPINNVEVDLYEMTSDKRVAAKTMTQIYQKDCTLKGDVDLTNPVFILSGNVADYATINYMYVPKFKRYYFLDPPRVLPGENGLVEVSGHCDVLTTAWTSGLKALDAIVDRQETYYNLYLNDGTFQACANDNVVTKEFPYGFSTPKYVLVVAG